MASIFDTITSSIGSFADAANNGLASIGGVVTNYRSIFDRPKPASPTPPPIAAAVTAPGQSELTKYLPYIAIAFVLLIVLILIRR